MSPKQLKFVFTDRKRVADAGRIPITNMINRASGLFASVR